MTTIHLEWPRSDSRAPVFTVLDADEAAVDLSTATITFTARKASDDSTLATLTTTDNDISVGGGNNNEVTVSVSANETSDWPIGKWTVKYDLQVELGSDVITVASGRITIVEDQTRS